MTYNSYYALKYLEQETKQKINREIDHFISEVVNEVTKNESNVKQLTNIFNNNYEITDKVKVLNGRLPEKVFVCRNSLLSDLYTIKHIRTIYHIFIALFVGQCIHNAVEDYLSSGQILIGTDKIFNGLAKFDVAATLWITMFLLTLANYVFFVCWSNIRINIFPNTLKLKMWDCVWIGSLICYYISFFYYFTNAVFNNKFPPPTAIIVLIESVRLTMKSYAFIRSNVPRVLNYKSHSEKENPCPSFSKFLYFLFAPTLIYKDNYPRTRTIRWKAVFFYAIEFTSIILFISFFMNRYFLSVFQDYGKGPIPWKEVALHTLGNLPAGGAFMLCGFYILLHVWLNGFAEILTFGDRMFYKDWWNSTSYGPYYRKWNVVVHDWLYTYIYKDMYENVLPKNRFVPKLFVFFVSALVHEYILSVAFGFFFPILFLEFFVIGVTLVFLTFGGTFHGNIFLWFTIPFGACLAINMYCIEYFVRQNCPIENATATDFFIPRLLTCKQL
ncbi:sterol O-acyltransferase 1 isoform X2 [Agrilus planipennis]|uniref:O-acyltransferase n=1 Tax=Agrilus planipennis TaxID=224129 RepID=A0A1W4W8E5_AGRPL|nr:sterol O-acyltransferase 1 isoform X2 [Agrilus planipennis]